MKKLLFLSLIAIGLLSFGTMLDKGYILSGTAAGVANGKKILLQKQDDVLGIVTVDSTKVLDGKFAFKGSVLEPSIHFLEVEQVQGKVAFILENGKISFTIYKDSIGKSRIGGTKNNDDLQNFNLAAMKVQKKMMDFQTQNNQKMQDAQTAKDTVVMNQLMKQYNSYQDEMMGLSAGFPEKNPKSFISVLFVDNMFNNPKVDIEKIRKSYDGLDASVKNTKPGRAVKAKIDKYKSIEIGSMAPDFSAPTPEGKTASLKASLGKVTIIDFWASWCGPCRKENPNVVKVYNEFHSKGLNIISVSLDKDGEKWKDAIAKDGLTWTHVSNLKFWQDPIAEMYNIKSIPATFILDASGKIIARDLRGADLRTKIVSLLGE